MITEQEFFDKTVRHLVKQGRPARNYAHGGDGPACRYRYGKLKCAVGCHIPDRVYHEKMDEGINVQRLLERFPVLNKYVPNILLARRLQNAHDHLENWSDPTKMVDALNDCAAEFNLNSNIVKALDFSNIHS